MNEARHGLLQFVTGHRSLLKCTRHAAAKFGLIEWLAGIIVLNQTRHHQFGRLKRRKTLTAIEALTTPSNLPAIGRQARINNLGLFVTAKRAMHWRLSVYGEALAKVEDLAAYALYRLFVIDVVKYIRYPAC